MIDSNREAKRKWFGDCFSVQPKRLVAAKLSLEDSALLDRACARLRITRTEAVHRGVRRILNRQREIEAMKPGG